MRWQASAHKGKFAGPGRGQERGLPPGPGEGGGERGVRAARGAGCLRQTVPEGDSLQPRRHPKEVFLRLPVSGSILAGNVCSRDWPTTGENLPLLISARKDWCRRPSEGVSTAVPTLTRTRRTALQSPESQETEVGKVTLDPRRRSLQVGGQEARSRRSLSFHGSPVLCTHVPSESLRNCPGAERWPQGAEPFQTPEPVGSGVSN